MRDEIRKILDGETGEEEARAILSRLPEAERREAEALLLIAGAAARLERASPSEGFATRAMTRVRSRPAPRRRLSTWLRTPALSPLGALAGAVAAALLAVAGARLLEPSPLHPGGEPEPVLARLELRAPGARSVAVAGDFNGWRPEATPLRRGEGGVWSVRIPLVPGRRYEYSFLVDGEWVADPGAPATAEDGFGGRNAVLEL